VAAVLALLVTLGSIMPVSAQLGENELPPSMQPMRLMGPDKGRQLKPREKQTLEDIFRKADMKSMSGPPIDLGATFIPGLNEKSVWQLGMNYFVVLNGTQYSKISDIYAENRAENKPNFVTVDSILHPYFAFANGMLASAIEEGVYKDLEQLLKAMVNSSISDYRRTEDDEVKDDIQRNLAYLCVAIKLLDPAVQLPDIGGAVDLVNADYSLIVNGKSGRSQIFSVNQDFGTFRPWGFLSQRPKLKRFHMAYQWLSRMQFPLSNTTNNTLEGGGNSFRRAVLLYRSIVLAGNVGKEPAFDKWNRIALAVALINFDHNAKKKTIVPPELASVFKTSESDLNRLLHSLSQPFLRTKLLLSVRNQRPLELNARSVFEMDQSGGTAGDDVVFRLFPLIDSPELTWLREEAHAYTEPAEGPARVPLALINLHAHGAQQATNVLSEQLDTLDIGLTKRVPRLERLVKLVSPDDAATDRHWGLISSIYRPYPDTVQIGLRSDLWLVKQLETAMSAWIDSYSACLVIPKTAPAESATKPAADATATEKPKDAQSGPARPTPPQPQPPKSEGPGANPKPARFHYLEPRFEIYKNLQVDCQNLIKQLTELNYMPERYLPRSQDFMRLLKRLTVISEAEIKNEPISMSDFNLLANIDRVLGPVDCPLASYLYLDDLTAGPEKTEPALADKNASLLKGREVSTATRTGATFGIGRAGKIFIICSTSQGSMLTRGGCYTFYETQGGPQKDEHWERKLTYNLLLPPYWTRKFNMVQGDMQNGDGRIRKDGTPSRSSPPKQL